MLSTPSRNNSSSMLTKIIEDSKESLMTEDDQMSLMIPSHNDHEINFGERSRFCERVGRENIQMKSFPVLEIEFLKPIPSSPENFKKEVVSDCSTKETPKITSGRVLRNLSGKNSWRNLRRNQPTDSFM